MPSPRHSPKVPHPGAPRPEASAIRPPSASVQPKEVNFELFDKQLECMELLEDRTHSEILYGGGARGGKSYVGCAWVVAGALRYPGSHWLVGRKDLKQLKLTTMVTFRKVFKLMGMDWEACSYNDTLGMLKLPNGSVVYFAHLKQTPEDPDFDRFGSMDLTGFFIDEAQEVRWKCVAVLKGRLSLTRYDENGIKWETMPKSLFTCNPNKGWVRSLFVKPQREGYIEGHRAFVKALVTDNPKVGPEYVEELLRSGDPVTIERLLYGNFDYSDDLGTLFQPDVLDDLFRNRAPDGERYITVDVARFGKDSSVVWLWKGLTARLLFKKQGLSTVQLAEAVRDLEIKHGVERRNVGVDADGVGGGVVDQLRGCVPFVNNGSPVQPMDAKHNPSFKVQWSNLKTQCYVKLAEMAKLGRVGIDGTDMAPDDVVTLKEELGAHRLENPDDDGKKRLVAKDEMKEDLGHSPDLSDALAIRMWWELQPFTPKDRPLGTEARTFGTRRPTIARRFFNPATARWESR